MSKHGNLLHELRQTYKPTVEKPNDLFGHQLATRIQIETALLPTTEPTTEKDFERWLKLEQVTNEELEKVSMEK